MKSLRLVKLLLLIFKILTSTDQTPVMEECPRLSDPVLVDGLYVYFYCDISNQYTKKDPVSFQVDFLFDNAVDVKVPSFLLKGSESRVGLHEKYLHGNLGKQVRLSAVKSKCFPPIFPTTDCQNCQSSF